MMYEVPDFLRLAPKMYGIIRHFNEYRYFLAEGGRGGGKTQAVGRILLDICEKKKVRVVCGRETQSSIEESVYKVLCDLIRSYNLNYRIMSNKIIHNTSGSEIMFKGFREQGAVNIKGLEGVNILWIDEAQAITKSTLDVVLPTIRAPKSKIIFTMNRKLPKDPVFDYCVGNAQCLHIKINYTDNPFCTQELRDMAELCRLNNEADYRHIWLGEPEDITGDMLFSSVDVARMATIEPVGAKENNIRIMAIDFAAQGGDKTVATILDKETFTQWRVVAQIGWQEPNPMASVGRITELIGEYKPDFKIIDSGGMGYVVHSRLQEIGINIDRFDGASTENVPPEYHNKRAHGYYMLADFVRSGRIIMKSDVCEAELLTIRYKTSSSGKRLIRSKEEMRKDGIKSPDYADSLMMAVYLVKTRVKDTMNLTGMLKPLVVNKSRWQI